MFFLKEKNPYFCAPATEAVKIGTGEVDEWLKSVVC